MMQSTKIAKKHLKVADVARQLGVKKVLIREWEKEFGVISERSKICANMDAQEKLAAFVRIKELLCKQGKSIADVKKEMMLVGDCAEKVTNAQVELSEHGISNEQVVVQSPEDTMCVVNAAVMDRSEEGTQVQSSTSDAFEQRYVSFGLDEQTRMQLADFKLHLIKLKQLLG